MKLLKSIYNAWKNELSFMLFFTIVDILAMNNLRLIMNKYGEKINEHGEMVFANVALIGLFTILSIIFILAEYESIQLDVIIEENKEEEDILSTDNIKKILR